MREDKAIKARSLSTDTRGPPCHRSTGRLRFLLRHPGVFVIPKASSLVHVVKRRRGDPRIERCRIGENRPAYTPRKTTGVVCHIYGRHTQNGGPTYRSVDVPVNARVTRQFIAHDSMALATPASRRPTAP